MIISGEHFVVHGGCSLASSIARFARATATFSNQIKVTSTRASTRSLAAYEACVKATLDHLNEDRRIEIRIDSKIPVASGLGSSAACAVACVAAATKLLNRKLELQELMTLSGKAEEIIHGRASGVDVAAATFGGLILYRRSSPPIPLKTYGKIPIIIALTGQRRMTAKMVAQVGEVKKKNEDLFDHLLYTSSELTKLAATSMQKHDVKTLGRIMNFHQQALRWLQVSNDEIDEIVNQTIKRGAAGAKLTGAGGGGAVIILPKEGAEYSMLRSVREIVSNAFLSQIPAGGVRSWLEE